MADRANDPLPGAARHELPDGTRDDLVREEPLLISIAGQQVLTMRTPGDDDVLALGFLLSEGVIEDAKAIAGHTFVPGDPAKQQPDTIELDPTGATAVAVTGRLTRTHEIRSSCGICGLTDADDMLEDTKPLLPGVPKVSLVTIESLRKDFESRLPLFTATGACHGAVLYDQEGEVLGQGEDVGRHNALDKAIGSAAFAGHDLRSAIALLSGRAGYDLTIKCLRLGIPVVLSISAPSSLSVDLCSAAGATLCGFVRPDRVKVYSDGGRIVTDR